MSGQTDSYQSIPFPADRKVIVDGAPAARFAQRLKELIESGEVLNHGG